MAIFVCLGQWVIHGTHFNYKLILILADVVPAPKDLRFSEVTQTSFRVHWEHGAPDVALYRIAWKKQGEQDFQQVST